MNELVKYILDQYELFFLVFVRLTGLFFITPIFSRKNIPNKYKIGFIFMVTLLLVNTVNGPAYNNYLIYTFDLIKELAIGLVLGFVAYLFFVSFFVAGQIIDTQVGFAMVNVFDPQSNAQLPITGNFLYMLSLVLFLILNGHHILLKALIYSFEIIPIGGLSNNPIIYQEVINIFSRVFIIGFKISSPILAVILLSNVLLGFLARTIPQMNVFVVGMPFKIFIGLLSIILILPILGTTLQHIFESMGEEVFNFLKVLVSE